MGPPANKVRCEMTRARILGRIARANRARPIVTAGTPDAPIPDSRLETRQHSAQTLADSFVECLTSNGANVAHIACQEEIPAQIAAWLRELDVRPAQVRFAPDPRFKNLDWPAAHFEAAFGACQTADDVALSHAAGAIADTGCLVVESGPQSPTSLAFLPAIHFIAVNEDDIAPNLAAALAHIKEHHGSQPLPRAINIISGPSRTADIAGKIVHGAHGPRWLGVLLCAVNGARVPAT